MELIAAVALAVATAAVWRAWREAAAREAEARARQEAEERAQREAEAREAEARARQEAEERAQREAEAREAEARARQEAEERAQRARARAKAEIEAREAEAQARKEAEARARAAERRAAKLGDDLAEARASAVERADESTIVRALQRALPALDPERAQRLERQLESLARNRASEAQLLKELSATADEAVREQLQKRIEKFRFDAEALLKRLRHVISEEPALGGVKLALAWEVRSAPDKKPKKEKEGK